MKEVVDRCKRDPLDDRVVADQELGYLIQAA